MQSLQACPKLSFSMSEDSESNQSLSIRCPACRQRFNVDKGLMDKMVECGACESRFRVSQDVIISSKKFYPGERGDPGLNQFKRTPLATAPAPKGMQTMQYADFKHPEQLGPTSPLRVIAGISGVALMLIVALLFLFSGSPNGVFSGLELVNKLVIAGFSAFLGFVLLVYANPKARIKAVFFGLLLAAGLVSIPLFFKPVASTQNTGPGTAEVEPTQEVPTALGSGLEDLKERFGTTPLDEARSSLKKEGAAGNVFGVYLTGLVERNIYGARDYLIRETQADVSSHPYPRDNGDYLMLLTGVQGDLDLVSRIAANLGEVEETHPELGVIVIRVDNEQFIAASAEKVNNQSDPEFYILNLRELGSVDLDRVELAVNRLALAKPSIFQADISRMLVAIMEKPGVRFHDSIARALLVWAPEPGPAGVAALQIVRKYTAEGTLVPEPLVDLVVKENPPGAAPVIGELWVKNPNLWQSRYMKFGLLIEADVLEQLGAEDETLRRSALTILAAVGTDKSLPAVRALANDPEPSIRVLAERAATEIGSR